MKYIALISAVAAVTKLGDLRADDHELIQLHSRLHDDEVDHSGEYYDAFEIGMAPLGVEYVRKYPDSYNEESQNHFMYLILSNFALEGKNADGSPNQTFKMD